MLPNGQKKQSHFLSNGFALDVLDVDYNDSIDNSQTRYHRHNQIYGVVHHFRFSRSLLLTSFSVPTLRKGRVSQSSFFKILILKFLEYCLVLCVLHLS